MMSSSSAELLISSDDRLVNCHGAWTVTGVADLAKNIDKINFPDDAEIIVDGAKITAMDTAGAWLLLKLQERLLKQGRKIIWQGFSKEHVALLDLIKEEKDALTKPIPAAPRKGLLYLIGENAYFRYLKNLDLIGFIGEIALSFANLLKKPKEIQWRAFLNVIDETGYRALAIVALLSFAIGVVLAYQMGQQLKIYGANVYIVGLMSVGVLQEFGPLITAIIIAGRTSSSFTAQLGTMKINEEIDALQTMGISPVQRLVLPKIFGLIAAMPLLIVWADIFGMLGGMVMSKRLLDVGYIPFLIRMPQVTELQTFYNGLIKAPFFAAIISVVGCFQGFQVKYSADSVGKQTTRSVVQAIFLIILADALFSVIQPWQMIK